MYNFEVKNKSDTESDIYIYGVLTDEKWSDDETTPSDIIKRIKTLKTKSVINLYINSPGGNVFSGVSIYNLLKRLPGKIITTVDGIAASSASIVAMAGAEIGMSAGSFIMIHNATSVVGGTSRDMRSAADTLDLLDNSIGDIYVERTGIDKKKVLEMMDVETLFDAKSAVENKFADRIVGGKKINALWDGAQYILNNVKFNPNDFKKFPDLKKVDYSEHETIIINNEILNNIMGVV